MKLIPLSHLNAPLQPGSRVFDVLRFGPFEVRAQSGILLRNGERVRIQDLPFRLLIVLLEQPGTVVSREELRNRLWGDGTFVDFDNNLRVAAAKLREALGEKAKEPRYLETIPGYGYRFLAEVEAVSGGSPAAAAGSPLQLLSTQPPGEEPRLPASRKKSTGRGLAVALTGLIVALAVLGIVRYEERPLIGSQDKVVVGTFANRTDDHGYDGALTLPFRLKMEESPYLSLVSSQHLVGFIQHPGSATLVNELRACRSLRAQVLVRGQLLPAGKGFELNVSAFRCGDGKLLASERAEADARADVLPALSRVTGEMRIRLGESHSSLQRFNVPLMQATTGSLAALRAFTQGEEKHVNGLETESIADFRLAIDLDPKFALAYAQLGAAYANAGQVALARQYLRRAFDLRDRTTDREKLYIAAKYYSFATGETERAIDAYQIWSEVYPHDIIPVNNLASQYILIGQPEKAAPLARKAVQMDSSIGLPYGMLELVDLESGDYSDLKQLCNDLRLGSIVGAAFHLPCYEEAFVQHDEAGMERQLQWARGTPQENVFLGAAGDVAFHRGQLQKSKRFFAEATKSALDNNLSQVAANLELNEAGMEAELGEWQQAQMASANALKLAPDSAEAEANAALVLARTGDVSGAQMEAKRAFDQAPLNTILNSAELATVYAAIRLDQHDPEGAVQALEQARPYDFCLGMGLSPIYYRGLAYLEAKQWAQAIQEFNRAIDHRAIAPDSPYVVLSRLELGRAYQLSGDRADALRVYRRLAETWKNADRDFPPLEQLHAYQRELSVPGQGSVH
jgi:DNA-binding winged helix-turn-helix (wHTH) protein/tetratricopeptide (TPR) repeat protein